MSIRSSAFKLKERVTHSVTSHIVASRPGAVSDGFVKAGNDSESSRRAAEQFVAIADLAGIVCGDGDNLLDGANIDYWSHATASGKAAHVWC